MDAIRIELTREEANTVIDTLVFVTAIDQAARNPSDTDEFDDEDDVEFDEADVCDAEMTGIARRIIAKVTRAMKRIRKPGSNGVE